MSDATLFDLDPDSSRNANDFIMARNLAEALHRHYPNHLWGVNVEGRTGIISIKNLYLSGNWGYVLKMGAVYSISSLERDAVRAGGEILERFRMSRAQFQAQQYADKPVDFAGRLLFDKS
jgi:hypothetical protein